MRWWAVVALAVAGLAAAARAGDIYQWTDHGQVHYSNTPSSSAPWERVPDAGTPGAGAPAVSADQGADEASNAAAIQRNAMERDIRDTHRRIREIDARLAVLGRARTQNSIGSVATGGVGTTAVDVRSEEERTLAEQREQLVKHVDEVHADAAKLRDELTTRLGSTPAWWNDPR